MLGTSRVLTTNTGVVCYDADFYPYGGERPYTNTCTTHYKFEGKERDAETGNDDFGARYYSNRFGRWLSSDWSATPIAIPYANLSNPQTLNLYSMVADDPESFVDLDGHDWDKAWQDLRTFGHSIYVRVSGGVGFGGGKDGTKAEIAVKINIETSKDAALRISSTAEGGGTIEVGKGKEVGEKISVDRTLMTVHDDGHVTGPEDAKVSIVDSIGGHTTAEKSDEEVGLSFEVGRGALAGGAVGATRWSALKDAAVEAKKSLTNPGPPPASKPPSPPPPPTRPKVPEGAMP